MMFPTIFTLGIDQLGPLTGKASGLLIMAIVGGAILPVLQGALLVIMVSTLLVNLLIDSLYRVIDPRVRLS